MTLQREKWLGLLTEFVTPPTIEFDGRCTEGKAKKYAQKVTV